MRLSSFPGSLILGVLLTSCAAYKQNIMFRANPEHLKQQADQAESNYVIQKTDLLQLQVYTNQGERLIDPNLESFKQATDSRNSATSAAVTYLVDQTGTTKFPMVGELKLEGSTLRQAEQILQKEYAKFYEEPFVVLKFANKRVIVLGAPGGQVIPILNEHTTLVEVLALAKGIGLDGKAHNIRVLRGTDVYLADLSTVEGYLKNNMTVQSGDIVYVEPVRRPFSEGLREYGPIVSIITSLGTLIIVILQLK